MTQSSSPLKNQKHEKFATLIADGQLGWKAYRSVYGTKPSVSRANSARLLANASVRARVEFLQAENAKVAAMNREEKRQLLAEIARKAAVVSASNGGTVSNPDWRARIAAIAEDNRMTGESAENVNVKGTVGISINLGGFFDRGKATSK